MKTISVISRKGGAGKTTLAVNLALTAQAEGRRVLLIDSDPQRSASLVLRLRTQAPPLPVREALAGKIFQAMQWAQRDGFDLIVVDTPAHPDGDVAQAANCADLCLIACRPTFLDIASVLQSAEMLRRLNRRGAVVLTQTPPPRGQIQPPAVQRAREALGLTGLPIAGVISSRQAFQYSLASGRGAAEAGSEPARRELEPLWRFVEALATGRPDLRLVPSSAGAEVR